ncbi:hypothetical protein GWN63_04985 [Candidatus Bathyarchaeota archaeon]|nr:hypothetical protein [Candidatus Bathyarchaeota archaeon]NIV68006.1 hypothetical protein [Candidatus Bathyarchaeota archaeon]NIW34544.1 hypothetical protein [Candidatus Bathyarchaeota archaeon]
MSKRWRPRFDEEIQRKQGPHLDSKAKRRREAKQEIEEELESFEEDNYWAPTSWEPSPHPDGESDDSRDQDTPARDEG